MCTNTPYIHVPYLHLITIESKNMEPLKDLLFPSIPLLFLTLISLYILYSITKGNFFKKDRNLPPSPSKLPFIGNLHQIGSPLHQSLHDLSLKHGPLMLIDLGQTPFLVVSSSDAACSIMRTHDHVFASRPPSVVTDIIKFIDIGFEPYGENWRQLRKIFISHLLTSNMVNNSHKIIEEEEVGHMIQEIRNRVSSRNSRPIDMSDVLSSFMTSLISRIVCGDFIKEEVGRLGTLKELVRERNDLISQLSIGDLFPCLSWMEGFVGLTKRAKRCREGWDVLLTEMIRAHEKRRESGEGGDFVDVLLSLKNDSKMIFDLDMEHIKGLIADAFAAGTDTTYITLEWAMSELVRNPEIMKKLQNEVRGIVKNKSIIESEDLNKMNYLKAVIKETLRLHPPVPLLLTRQSMEECNIHNFTIPKGVRIFINVWAISREPKSWEAPEEFMPERFIVNVVNYKGKDFQFIPFGAGRRICPGIQFSMATAELALANLVHQFDWEFPSGVTADNINMSDREGVTVPRKESLQLVAHCIDF